MPMTRSRATVVAVVVIFVLIVGAATVALVVRVGVGPPSKSLTTSSNGCASGGAHGVETTRLSTVEFGLVKEYALPQPSRLSNGIAVAPDGSVWFGEQSVPGVAHLLLNGSLVEYPWPTANRQSNAGCGYKTGIWGVAYWNGRVWAADGDEGALVGVDPLTGETTVINVSSTAPLPYTLAAAPDGSLWFTSLSTSAKLGRLSANLTLSVFSVLGLNGEVPFQVEFQNSSAAYFVATNPLKPFGHLYWFDPGSVSGRTIVPTLVSTQNILEPLSLTRAAGALWVTQHRSSSIVSFNLTSRGWTTYPTSTENFTYSTLPYFIDGSGDSVWFNEHYANRIAYLNSSAGTLTEFSEADPPISNGSLIQNDLTLAHGDGGTWFTSMTGNYIGFVNTSYAPSFSVAVQGSNSVNATQGKTVRLVLEVKGTWSSELRFESSDSENYSSIPRLLDIAPNVSHLGPGEGSASIAISITPSSELAPGRYTIALSVTDGLVTGSAFVFISVSP